MKITIYTIADCLFCKQEKEYLNSHSLPFEEKSLEANKEFLTEMLAVSNNFAGTPVTKIEKEDGQISVLKGFTKEEFDKVLGFEEKIVSPTKPETAQLAPTPSAPPIAPIPEVIPPPVINPVPEITTAPSPKPVENPEQKQLDSILNNLEQKTVAPPPLPLNPIPEVSNPPVQPSIPSAPAQNLPTIPDLKI